MSYLEPLFKYCKENGRFPDEPDVSKQLEVLEYIVKENEMSLPYPVDLVRYGEGNIYCIDDNDLVMFKAFPTKEAIPFVAENDEQALNKLEVELSQYRRGNNDPIFVRGKIIQQGENPLYEEMMNNPLEARLIWEEVESFV